MNVVEISGVRYIKASDAAKRVGYTTDYVGQLARAGKIDAQQIGRAWYVKEDDILDHKKGNARSNKQKTQEYLQKSVGEAVKEHAIYNSMYTPPVYMPEYRKRLLDASVKYERDGSPLTLSLRQNHSDHHAEEIAVTADSDENELHTSKLGRDLDVGEHTNISILHAERAPEPPMHGHVAVRSEETYQEPEDEALEEKVAEPAEPLSPFEERLLRAEEAVHPIVAHVPAPQRPPHTQEYVPSLTFIPANLPGPRRPLALGRRMVTALTPVALILALTFVCSTIFLHKVIVYQKGQGIGTSPSFLTSYGVTEMATVRSALSR